MDRKTNHVRLTTQAHILCAEKAEDYKTSMKAVASEAIFLLNRADDRAKEFVRLKLEVERLERKTIDNKWHAFGAFFLGAISAGCLMFFIGVLW